MSKNKNKKNNIFKSIFRGIYKILDTLLVTPISRIIYKFNKFLKRNANKLDGILNKPHSLIVFSLIVAVLVFLLVDSKAINLVETESEILFSQPVSVIYNEEKYVVEGVPDTVDILLMGRKSDLYLAKQLGEHKVTLDLSDYKTGEYTVKLKYNHTVKSISYELIPPTVTVKISEKESEIRTLTYDLLNQDKLDSKLNVSEVELNESEVYVKGSKETLAKVATVKALIDVTTLELKEAGTFPVDSLPMVAYDETGKVVENVEIVPSTASATIKVDSYYKDLPVKVVPVGNFATGYAISKATSSVTTVRVYGDQNTINRYAYISAEIDVDGLKEDKKFNVTLTKPSGVRYMSEGTTTVNVEVGTESSIEISGISIESENLGSAYVANIVNGENTCTVVVKGVAEVINNIKADSIKAVVDLSGYNPGTYDVPIVVKGDDLTATYTAVVKSVQIKISNKD